MSETVSEAFVAAAAKLSNPPKTKTGGGASYAYKYADIADILDAVRPILAAEGLAVMQDAISDPDRAGVAVTTRIIHASGGELVFGPLWLPAKADPQAMGGAITYARRYQLAAALGIAADEDKDGGKSVDGSTAEATPSTAPAQNRDKDRGPSRTSAGAGARQGSDSFGEGGTESEGNPAPAVDLDALELMQLAVKAHGNSLKALMAHVRAAHQEWEIRSVSDLTEGQMAVLVDCEHAA